MVSRMYSVEQCGSTSSSKITSFKGFDRNVVGAKYLALTMNEGEPEVYALDSQDCTELLRYLAFAYEGRATHVATYRLMS